MGYSRKSRNIVRTEEEKDCCGHGGTIEHLHDDLSREK